MCKWLVDASDRAVEQQQVAVFLRIPGFFLVSAVYMIGEKAADVIAASAATAPRLGPVKPFAT